MRLTFAEINILQRQHHAFRRLYGQAVYAFIIMSLAVGRTQEIIVTRCIARPNKANRRISVDEPEMSLVNRKCNSQIIAINILTCYLRVKISSLSLVFISNKISRYAKH